MFLGLNKIDRGQLHIKRVDDACRCCVPLEIDRIQSGSNGHVEIIGFI